MTQPISNPGRKSPKEKKVDNRHWYQKKRWMLPLGFIALSSIVSALTGGNSPTDAAEPTQTVEETQTQDAVQSLSVPDLVGQNTSDALDELEALGFTEAVAQDASYEERNVLLASNWFVCELRPSPGTTLDSNQTVVLLSVKNSEACPNSTPTTTPSESASASESQEPAPSTDGDEFGNLTSAQIKMSTLISDYQTKYDSADNDLQRGNLRLERDESICSAIGGSKVSGWSGVVEDFGATSEGYAYLTIAVGPDITLETWNNGFSDAFDNTLIERGTTLYDTLLSLKKGQVVTFSGTFVKGDGACLDTKNLTEFFAMYSPEFVFKFSSLKP